MEEQRHHILRGDGLSRIQPQKHRRALQRRRGSALVHIVAFHFFIFHAARVPCAHARFHMRLIRLPCFPMRTKFGASYVHISAAHLGWKILISQNYSASVKGGLIESVVFLFILEPPPLTVPHFLLDSPKHLLPSNAHSHSIRSHSLAGPHSVPPSTSLWLKWASNVSKSRRSAAAYSGLSPIMLRAIRRVDQMLSDIMVAAAPPGPLAALPPSPAAWRWRERASRKCSTASLKGRKETSVYEVCLRI